MVEISEIRDVLKSLESLKGIVDGLSDDDDLFENDGQLTKAEIRALTLSALRPHPGQHLWDVGAGAGSESGSGRS